MIRPYSQLFENQFSPHLEVMEFILPEIKQKTESKNEHVVIDEKQQVTEEKHCDETSIVVIDESSLKNITPKQFFRRK